MHMNYGINVSGVEPLEYIVVFVILIEFRIKTFEKYPPQMIYSKCKNLYPHPNETVKYFIQFLCSDSWLQNHDSDYLVFFVCDIAFHCSTGISAFCSLGDKLSIPFPCLVVPFPMELKTHTKVFVVFFSWTNCTNIHWPLLNC